MPRRERSGRTTSAVSPGLQPGLPVYGAAMPANRGCHRTPPFYADVLLFAQTVTSHAGDINSRGQVVADIPVHGAGQRVYRSSGGHAVRMRLTLTAAPGDWRREQSEIRPFGLLFRDFHGELHGRM